MSRAADTSPRAPAPRDTGVAVDFSALTAYQRYKLMASLIVPRPIALVTTLNATGVVNAAPFSMFNMLGEDPPILDDQHQQAGRRSSSRTRRRTSANGEFVVHIADEPMAEQMHRAATALPATDSELVARRVHPVAVARGAPAAHRRSAGGLRMRAGREDRDQRAATSSSARAWLHARDGSDRHSSAYRVRLQNYFPVARFGASFYIRTRDRFAMSSGHGGAESTGIDEIV